MEKSVPGEGWKVKIRLYALPGCPGLPRTSRKDVFCLDERRTCPSTKAQPFAHTMTGSASSRQAGSVS